MNATKNPRRRMASAVLSASLALCGTAMMTSAAPTAHAAVVEDNTSNGRIKVDPGFLRTTVYFNKAETRAISRNGGYVTVIGSAAPSWARILGPIAAIIDNAADNAVSSGRCLKLTKYGPIAGAGVVLPGSYAGGHCR